MYNVLITAPPKVSWTTRQLIEEGRKKFNLHVISLYDITIEASPGAISCMHKRHSLVNMDYVLPKIDSKRLSYGHKVVRAFEACGKSVPFSLPYSSDTLLVAHDKFVTSLVLASRNVPVPRTLLLKTHEKMPREIRGLEFPVMVKLLSGSGGKGVMYVEDEESLASILKSMDILNQDVVVQEFVENPGADVRLIVLGDRVAGAYKRVASGGDPRSNLASGGSPVHYTPPPEVEEVAIRAAEAVGADILGVDVIESGNGPVVIEVNVNPGLKGFAKTSDRNMAKIIIDHIHDRIKR